MKKLFLTIMMLVVLVLFMSCSSTAKRTSDKSNSRGDWVPWTIGEPGARIGMPGLRIGPSDFDGSPTTD